MAVHLRGKGLGISGDILNKCLIGVQIYRESGGNNADQYQHNQSHSLLTIVGTMGKADTRAGQNQKTPNPKRRSLAFG